MGMRGDLNNGVSPGLRENGVLSQRWGDLAEQLGHSFEITEISHPGSKNHAFQ